MSFELMLITLFGFVYFGIGIGTILKLNQYIPGNIIRVKLLLLLPLETFVLLTLVCFDAVPSIIQASIKKVEWKNKIIFLGMVIYFVGYILLICLKFVPIMSAMLALGTIGKNSVSKIALKNVRNRYSDMIGEIVLCG